MLSATADRNRWLHLSAVVLLLGAIYFAGGALYIHGKAGLAQLLLQRAWSAALMGASEVRPWPWADTWPVARLEAPRLGVDLIVLDGVSGASLAFAPGLLKWAAGPDSLLLAGHRDTHFRFLSDLQPADLIVVHTRGGESRRYRVESMQIVNGADGGLRLDPSHERLILVTCFPFDAVEPGGDLRYVIYARALPDRKPDRHVSSHIDPIASTLHPPPSHSAPL